MADPTVTALVVALLGLPLAGFLVMALGWRRLPARAAGVIGCLAVGLAFAAGLALWGAYVQSVPEAGKGGEASPVEVVLYRWIEAGAPEAQLTVAAAPITALETVRADQVGTVWWPTDANVDTFIARMWDPAAVVGARPMAADVGRGSVLTFDNVPPAPEAVAATPVHRAPMVVDARFQVDPLSLFMVLIVTGVGFLIHVYSVGYMAGDPGVRRYFAYLNLFVFSMVTLVLAGDFLVLFVGWELVGMCSYLLIGYWFDDPANASAGRKAFVVNRVGDLGFLIGLLLIWSTFGSLAYGDVLPQAATTLAAGSTVAVLIALCLLVGATGKSAQLPLFVWLPDAMAGPTPVSALIHAATMVTAGVYMMVRSHALFEMAPGVMALVALVGVGTALVGALAAVVQVDIKRLLAYSTISQLGYMVLAVGAAAYTAALFHLMTHAFFKALLFLGAGSVMHAMEHGIGHGEGNGAYGAAEPVAAGPDDLFAGTPAIQDMRQMGGLRHRLRWTAPTFAAGALALAGIVPFAGFWSKDEILLATFAHGGPFWLALYALALAAAFVTALYAGKALFVMFAGSPRSAGARHAHESPWAMTLPLVVLALLSLVGGFANVPFLSGGLLGHWLDPIVGAHSESGTPAALLAAVALTTAVAGLATSWWWFKRATATEGTYDEGALPVLDPRSAFGRSAASAFGVDGFYLAAFVAPFRRAADALWHTVDDRLIDGAANAVGRGTSATGQWLRASETGYLRSYAMTMVAGAALVGAVVVWALVR